MDWLVAGVCGVLTILYVSCVLLCVIEFAYPKQNQATYVFGFLLLVTSLASRAWLEVGTSGNILWLVVFILIWFRPYPIDLNMHNSPAGVYTCSLLFIAAILMGTAWLWVGTRGGEPWIWITHLSVESVSNILISSSAFVLCIFLLSEIMYETWCDVYEIVCGSVCISGLVCIVVMILVAALLRGGLCSSTEYQIDDTTGNETVERKCISREECPTYAVCYNMTFNFGLSMDDYGDAARLGASGSGSCQECSTFPLSECYPPCHYHGAMCSVDHFAFDMNLDQKLPYYMNAISAVTKPSVSLLVFTPTTMPSPKDRCWRWFKSNVIRGIFLAMAFNTFLVDLSYQWTVLLDPDMCWWMKLWALVTTISTSSNLTAAAAILSMFVAEIITDYAFDFCSLADKYGIIFVVYYLFLGVLYVPAIFVLVILSIPGLLAYCWLVVVYILLALLIGKYVSKTVTVYLSKSFAAAKVAIIGTNDNLEDPLLNQIEEKTKREVEELATACRESCWQGLFKVSSYDIYFCIPLGLPLISFMIPVSARLFNGYGYWQALWITLNERHATTFLNQIRRRYTTMVDFFWNML